jgi:pimeloyl-ACP methyl ester carboxylesterase
MAQGDTARGSAGRTEDRFATANGIRIHYRETTGGRETAGGGGPLLCLHGITSNARAWDGLAAELAPEYRVIAPDLRGRGDSDKPEDGYGLEGHAADAVGLLDELGIERAVLVGHSLGALIGMQLAAEYPERIAKLVLVDHGVNTPPETIEALRPFWARLTRTYPSWGAFLDAMRPSPAYPRWTPQIESYLEGDASVQPDETVRHKIPPRVPERDLEAAIGLDVPSLYPKIGCPTLVLRAPLALLAEGDQIIKPEQVETIVDGIADCRVVDIPGTNHFTIVIGHPPETTAALREFLAV